jgi:hypothetical protein
LKPLDAILYKMPRSIEHCEIHTWLNARMGIDPKKMPNDTITYSIGTILRAMRARGYRPVWKLQKVGRDHTIVGDETW